MAYNQDMTNAIRKVNRQPIWVVEILFNHGEHGVEGQNDVYIASAPVDDIVDFPYPDRYFPFLDSSSLTGLSQSLDIKQGISSIGNISFKVIDKDNLISKIIRAADDVNQGMRGQLVEVYQIERGMRWLDSRQKTRTMKMTSFKQAKDGLSYKFIAHDVQSDMQADVFEPEVTRLILPIAATDTSLTMLDSSRFHIVPHAVHGMVGHIKIDKEIMRWSAKTAAHVLTITRGVLGTVAAAHDADADVSEVTVLSGNGIAIALQVLCSTGSGTNGIYDVYPAHWGAGLLQNVDVNIAEIEHVGSLITGFVAGDYKSGMQAEFVYNKKWSAKTFIESRILKQVGAFSRIHSDGSYGMREYSDISQIAVENTERTLNVNNIVSVTDIDFDLPNIVNDVLVKFDEQPKLSGNYARTTRFLDAVSIVKNRKSKQPLLIKADGLIPRSVEVSAFYQRVHLIGAQQSRQSRKWGLTLMPSQADIMIGDIVRISYPIHDAYTGNHLDIAAQVDKIAISSKTGEPKIRVRSQHEKASFWQGSFGIPFAVIISPQDLQIQPGASYQLVLRVFDETGLQLPATAASWVASGDVAVSANGLVTATGVASGQVFALASSVQSNTVNITIRSASANPVATVDVYPSSTSLSISQSLQFNYAAKDLSGNTVNSSQVSWLSDNVAVATVSSTGLVTAVGNGLANITATTAGISSAASVVSVAAAVIPISTPPAIADIVYEVGTDMTLIWDGSTNKTLLAGDYWWSGDLTIASGITLTIHDTVRLFVRGIFTNNGHIDGKGNGSKGAVAVAAATHPKLRGDPGYYGKGGVGNPFIYKLHLDNPQGGWGGSLSYGGNVNQATYPAIIITPTSQDAAGTWTSISPLPISLVGSGGGANGINVQSLQHFDGANGGAGLLVMAKEIYSYVGTIDISGGDSLNSGGGGGGTFVALAEKHAAGTLPVNILASNVNISRGAEVMPVIDYPDLRSTNGAFIINYIG